MTVRDFDTSAADLGKNFVVRSLDRNTHSLESGSLWCRLQSSAANLFQERLVIALVLVGVALGELAEGFIECIARAQISGNGYRVARTGVRPRESPTTQPPATPDGASCHR
jgi:hypothetical protein